MGILPSAHRVIGQKAFKAIVRRLFAGVHSRMTKRSIMRGPGIPFSYPPPFGLPAIVHMRLRQRRATCASPKKHLFPSAKVLPPRPRAGSKMARCGPLRRAYPMVNVDVYQFRVPENVSNKLHGIKIGYRGPPRGGPRYHFRLPIAVQFDNGFQIWTFMNRLSGISPVLLSRNAVSSHSEACFIFIVK